ncbi:acyl-CoA synthetase [Plakobranchus ocellatus]|uniref:Acyl-CoA synthetase n=1 Tax=Plakobranchus ocellatus TaxID=259542 RepID=A0AAV4CSI7_9GAST|nr:acyl-CoA synthetase [Plakobranchus ocellatus]
MGLTSLALSLVAQPRNGFLKLSLKRCGVCGQQWLSARATRRNFANRFTVTVINARPCLFEIGIRVQYQSKEYVVIEVLSLKETCKPSAIMSLVSEILRKAEEMPEKPAFIFIGADFARTVLTFAEVSCLGRKFAAVLRNKGLGAGDVVCNTLANSPERLISK